MVALALFYGALLLMTMKYHMTLDWRNKLILMVLVTLFCEYTIENIFPDQWSGSPYSILAFILKPSFL